jgi:hypothetical protein
LPERVGLDLVSQRGMGKGDRNLAQQVLPVAREEGVLADGDHDVEIARGAAARPGLPLPAQLQPRPVVDARGDLHLQCPPFPGRPAAGTLGTLLPDDLPGPPAAAARPGRREEPLLDGYLPPPVARRAALGPRPLLRPAPTALLAGRGPGNDDLLLRPERPLLERDLQVVPEIRAAPRSLAAAEDRPEPEEFVDDVFHPAEVEVAEPLESGPLAGRACVSIGIVLLALLRVGEDGVGSLNS